MVVGDTILEENLLRKSAHRKISGLGDAIVVLDWYVPRRQMCICRRILLGGEVKLRIDNKFSHHMLQGK